MTILPIILHFYDNGDQFCKQTKDDNGSAHKKEEMDFDAHYVQDNADGETFDHGYYSYDGYDDNGAGGYNGIDDFDFE